MSMISDIYDVIAAFEGLYAFPREHLAILVNRKTEAEIMRECMRFPTEATIIGEKNLFGIPLIARSDIKESFCIAFIPCRATEKGAGDGNE